MLPFKFVLLKFDSSHANEQKCVYTHFATLYATLL